MAGETQVRLKGVVEFVLKDKGLVDAKARIDSLEKELAKIAKTSSSASGGFAKFGQSLAGLVSAGALIGFTKQGITEFAALERTLNATALRMRQLGLDASELKTLVLPALQAIQDGGGPLLTETVPIFQKFVSIVKDTNAALYATKLVSDISESGIMDAGQAAETFGNLLNGRVKEAVKEFDLALYKSNGQQKTNVELLEEAIDAYDELGNKTDDTQNALDVVSGEWSNLKLALGEGLATIVKLVGGVGGLSKAFKSLGPIFIKTFYEIKAFATAASLAGSAFFDVKTLATQGPAAYLAKVKSAWAEGWERLKPEIDGAREELDSIWDAPATTKIDADAAKKALLKQALNALSAEQDKERAKEAEKERKAQALAAKARVDWETSQIRMSEKLWSDYWARRQAQVSAEMERHYQTTVRGILSLSKAREDMQDAELEDERLANEARLEQDARSLEEHIALYQDYLREKRALDLVEADLAMERELEAAENRGATDEEIQIIRDRYALKRKQIETRLVQALKDLDTKRKESAVEAASASIAALASAFPRVKAFSIAEAIMNTWQSVTAILADKTVPFWVKPIAIAISVATGLANVAKIRKTNMAEGGLAVGSMEMTRGASRIAFGETPGARPEAFLPLNNPRTIDALAAALAQAGGGNVTINAHVVTEQGARELVRLLDRARRRDQARYVR